MASPTTAAKGTPRGVQNAARTARGDTSGRRRERGAGNVRDPNVFRRTVRTSSDRFSGQQSIGARTEKQRFDQGPAMEDSEVAERAPESAPRATSKRVGQETQQAAGSARRTLARRTNWWTIGAAAVCSYWIFILSAVGLGIMGIGHLQIFGITIDAVVSFVGSIVNALTGFGSGDLSVSAVGVGVGLVGSLIAFGGYLALGLWYWVGKGTYPDTTAGALTTFICVSADMILVTQIFPWMLLWVVLMELGWLSSARS